MTDLMKTISDEAQRKQATELAALPGWTPNLAAVAVLSGSAEAVEVISHALKQATAGPVGAVDESAKAEVARLQQKIAEAKQQKDFRRLVSLKTQLYAKYKIGSV
jgi:hypothetical protein